MVSDAKHHINHHHRHSWHGSVTTTNATNDAFPVDHNALIVGDIPDAVNGSEVLRVSANTNTSTMQARAEQQCLKENEKMSVKYV